MAATWIWDAERGGWKRIASRRGEEAAERPDGATERGRAAGRDGSGEGQERGRSRRTNGEGVLRDAGGQGADAGPQTGDAVIVASGGVYPDPAARYDGLWTLNEGAARPERMSGEELRRLCRMCGIGAAESLPDERLFRVAVANLEPLSIARLDSASGERLWQVWPDAGDWTELADGPERGSGAARGPWLEPVGMAVRGHEARLAPGEATARDRRRLRPDGSRAVAGAGAALPDEDGSPAQARGLRAQRPDAGRAADPPAYADAAQPSRWPADAALRRVARAAVRALYALRLDIGEADIALSGDGRCAVRGARPLLRDGRRQEAALRRFAAWHEAAHAVTEERRRILIGADPEFVLLLPGGRIAPASRYFGGGAGGAAGADAVLVGRRLLYPVAELRPAPAEDPAALAANVRRLMLAAAAKARDPGLRWVAGAMPVPGLALGGHIHISGAPLSGRLLRLLDSCAAYPLALVEDPAGRGRRPRYGALGDFRHQPHGGFEYRTLPSWLVSPAAAKAAFALALLCAREAMTLPRIPASAERYAEAYYAGDRTELAGCLDEIAGAISRTASYPALARCIEPLFDAARSGKTWDESADIRVKWRVPISR